MGQGQEDRAISAVQEAADTGGWVVLQNVHLMQEWLKVRKYLTLGIAVQGLGFEHYKRTPSYLLQLH